MFLAGCGAIGLNEVEIAQEQDTPAKTGITVCHRYGVLRGKGSIYIEWSITEGAEGDIFTVQRSRGGRRDFSDIREIRAGSGELTYKYSDRSCQPGSSYRYRVLHRPASGDQRVLFETGKYMALAVPTALHQNRPNPFDAATELQFSVAEKANTSLHVYDIEGKLVRVLVDSTLEPGFYEATWNGRDDSGRAVATGVYFCRLRAGGEMISRKLMLMR